MHLKKITASIIGIVLVGASVMSANAAIPSVGDPGQSWVIPNDNLLGEHIQEFLDTFPGGEASYLFNPSTPSLNSNQSDFLSDPTCTSAKDPRCVNTNLSYQAVLPNCLTDSDVNCISGFGTVDSSGTRTPASFSRYYPSKALNEYQGDPALHLPSGVAGSLYSLPGAAHDGGNLYYISVSVDGTGNSQNGFSIGNLQTHVYPIQLQPETYNNNPGTGSGFWLNNRGRADGTKYWGRAGGALFSQTQFCVAASSEEQTCAVRFAFPANIKFYLKVRLQKVPGGWMHGRIADPSILITPGSGYSELDIAANPVAVPAIYKMYNWVDMPPALRANYDTQTGAYINDPLFKQNPANAAPGGRSAGNADPLKRNVIFSPDSWSATGMEQLKLWLPYVNDQATALLSYWAVRSLSSGEMQGSNNCFNDPNSVTGIVTTNATQYSAGPPVFDKSQGALNYSVAAPHYTTTHDVFQGNYDLIMRSDVARCVYGFTKAPIKATISVTSADGSPQTATTILSETNGWVHLAANGFQFSNPSIQVKLTQDAPAPVASPTPSATPSALPVAHASSAPVAPKVPAKSTITCVKGKTVKAITAAKPTCPAGYKKK
jgi:hypothetical protein